MASELLLPWDSQPQIPIRVRPILRPIAGVQPGGYGVLDSQGSTLTIGSGISRVVKNAVGVDFAVTSTGLRRSITPVGYPLTFVGRISLRATGTWASSIATASDNLVRVGGFIGYARAQHLGSVTNAIVDTSGYVYYYDTFFNVVAVFASPTDLRIYAEGAAGKSSASNSTNIGVLAPLDKLAFGVYDGSAITGAQDGIMELAQWLNIAASPEQAWAWVCNPWSIFEDLAIPIKARIPAKHKTSELILPWNSQPIENVSPVDDIVCVASGSNTLIELATGNMAANPTPPVMWRDGLALNVKGDIFAVSPLASSFTYARANNRKNFTVFGRASIEDTYSMGGIAISLTSGYGWVVRFNDYGASTNFQLQDWWSSAYRVNIIIPTASLSKGIPFNFAVTIDTASNTWSLYLNGRHYQTGAWSGSLDPLESGITPSFRVASLFGNYLYVAGVAAGTNQAYALELSANPWLAFKPRSIPAGGPLVTTRREVSEMAVPWDRQPQNSRRLDFANSMTRDLLCAVNCADRVDAVSGQILSMGADYQSSIGVSGVAAASTGATGISGPFKGATVLDEVTIALILDPAVLYNNTYNSVYFAIGGDQSISIRNHPYSAGNSVLFTGYYYPSYNGAGYSTDVVFDGKHVKLVFSFKKNGRLKCWANGVLRSDVAAGAFPLNAALDAQSIKIGAGQDRSASVVGAFAWRRELSDAEALSWFNAPWQLFEPLQIPYDQPALVRQLDPLTPTDGMTPRLYLGS